MDDGLDTGPIIASKSCDLTEADTAWTLHNKVEILGEQLLDVWLSRLVRAKVPAAFPEPNHPLSLRFDESDKFIPDIYTKIQFIPMILLELSILIDTTTWLLR